MEAKNCLKEETSLQCKRSRQTLADMTMEMNIHILYRICIEKKNFLVGFREVVPRRHSYSIINYIILSENKIGRRVSFPLSTLLNILFKVLWVLRKRGPLNESWILFHECKGSKSGD